MRGWAGQAPCPLPPAPLTELWGGGLAGQVQPGDFEQGRGDLWQASRELKWQIFLASKFGGLFSQMNPSGFHGKIFWQVLLAHLFGGLFWRNHLAGFMVSETNKPQGKEKANKKKRKECTSSRSVNCLMPLYIVSNIMLFCSRYRFY
jgi:hypothetical protein